MYKVFVHLGSSIPLYLKNNLRALSIESVDSELCLIVSDRKYARGIPKSVEIFVYNRSEETEKLCKAHTHPKDFRNDFWFLSIERFIALNQFAMVHEGPILHFESDILVATDFPFHNFEKLNCDIAFPIVSDLRGVASVVYFRDPSSIRKFTKFCINEILHDSKTTDMLIMRKFYDQNRMSTEPLPTGVLEFRHFYESNIDVETNKRINDNLKLIGGVIDGHDIGVNLLGSDPRNRRGISKTYVGIPGSYIDQRKFSFKYNSARKFLDFKYEKNPMKKDIPIFAIHATVKYITLFDKNTRKIILKYFSKKPPIPKKRFNLRILAVSIFESIRRKMK